MNTNPTLSNSNSLASFWSQRSLQTKFSIPTSIIILLVIFVLTLATLVRETRTFDTDLVNDAGQILNVMQYTLRESLYLSDVNELQDLATIVQSSDEIIAVKVFNPDGVTLVDTTSESVGFSRAPTELGTQVTALEKDSQYISRQQQSYQVGIPVYAARQLLGGLVVEFSTATLEQNLTDMYQQTFGIAILSLAFALVAARFFVGLILRPLQELSSVTELFAAGDYKHQVKVRSNDEIGQLSVTFNRMASAVYKRDNDQIKRLEEQLIEVQKAREEAERSDKVKSAFLASMSHELRTPLNAIINFSKFLHRGICGPVNEEQEELSGKIAESGQHLLNLINDVLDMSKIEAGSLKLYVEEDVELQPILEQAVEFSSPLLEDKPVEIYRTFDADLPLLNGDRKRLLQVFLNILSNACKFTENGSITVGAEQRDNHVLISIADTGSGIAAEDSSHVFEAFKQTETGLRQGGGGTGLGMPICRKLVEAHDGRVWFESQVGVGTTFYVELPVNSSLEPERTM